MIWLFSLVRNRKLCAKASGLRVLSCWTRSFWWAATRNNCVSIKTTCSSSTRTNISGAGLVRFVTRATDSRPCRSTASSLSSAGMRTREAKSSPSNGTRFTDGTRPQISRQAQSKSATQPDKFGRLFDAFTRWSPTPLNYLPNFIYVILIFRRLVGIKCAKNFLPIFMIFKRCILEQILFSVFLFYYNCQLWCFVQLDVFETEFPTEFNIHNGP